MFIPSYFKHLSFTQKCVEIVVMALGAFLYALSALSLGAVVYIMIALALDLHPEQPQTVATVPSKAEQFASELANKNLGVKILVTRD